MTDRQARVLAKLKSAGTATTAELVEWCGCERRDAALTLGVMVRCGQLFRVGWTDRTGVVNGVALWGIDLPASKELPYNRELRIGNERMDLRNARTSKDQA